MVKKLSLQPRSIPLLINKKMMNKNITRKLKNWSHRPLILFLRWPISVTVSSSPSSQQYFLFIISTRKYFKTMMCKKDRRSMWPSESSRWINYSLLQCQASISNIQCLFLRSKIVVLSLHETGVFVTLGMTFNTFLFAFTKQPNLHQMSKTSFGRKPFHWNSQIREIMILQES